MAEQSAIFDQTDQDNLNFTLHTRRRIANEMLEGGKIPKDQEDRKFLLAALDGLDRTTLSRARIKADDSANQSQQHTIGIIAELLSKVNAHAVSGGVRLTGAPVLETVYQITDAVSGETEIGTQTMTYDAFIAEVDPD